MSRKNQEDLYPEDEKISKTQKLELDRYQKYLKSIRKYDPLDEEEYLYLTSEMGNIINKNDKLSDLEVLELTRKLEKIENTKDYTIELLELTKEIKQIIKPAKKKVDIPRVGKKENPRKPEVKPLTSTSVLPKINNNVRKKAAPVINKETLEKDKPKVKKELTFKDLVDKNTTNNIDHFNTEVIRKIRTSVNQPVVVRKKASKTSKMVWRLIFGVSLCSFAFLVIRFVKWELENRAVKNQISNIYAMAEINEVISAGAITDISEEIVTIPNEVTTKPQNIRPNDYWYYMSMSMLDVDFSELKQKNSDTVGWIQVAGTNVNYPYVHTGDNSYYLKHSFDKSYNSAGWVFLDYRNDPDNFGRNNIIYAHGRLDNTMFGSLKKIVTPSWYNNSGNYVIKTSNEKVNALWQVFSVYTILPESYYIKTKFSDSEFDKFLNTVTSRSVHDFNVETTQEDKILTLSTCYDETKRVVLHAKLIRIEEK